MTQNIKQIQYQDRILTELNRLFREQMSDARFRFVSVTKVELSTDFSQAKVYWDTYDSSQKNNIEKAMKGVKGKMRSILAKNLKVRHTPSLTFEYDTEFEDQAHIENLLKGKTDGDKAL